MITRTDRYAAFKKGLGLRKMAYTRTPKLEQLLGRGSGFDHTKIWTWASGGRRTAIVTTEPYTGARRARDHLRILGFEAAIVPGIELHYAGCDVVVGVLGQPGLLDELIEKALQIEAIRRSRPSRSMATGGQS
jgi:hypothetical protein